MFQGVKPDGGWIEMASDLATRRKCQGVYRHIRDVCDVTLLYVWAGRSHLYPSEGKAESEGFVNQHEQRQLASSCTL